jgi:hypothetical protein
MSEDLFSSMLEEVVVTPIADLLDRTCSIVDLSPLIKAKPWCATIAAKEELSRRGHELPTSW